MKKIITYIFCVLLFTPIACQNKKNNKKNMYLQKYEWLEATSAPLGYPVDVYMGGLQSEDGGFTSLYSGTTNGSWGEANRGMSNGEKSIPNHLHVKWISYAEKTFYEIDTSIVYEKMLQMFKEGYYTPSDGDNPNPRKEDYNKIIVGFAPGGVVVIWLSGAGRQIEVGRYEGKKIVIPQDEINSLSPGPQKNMFDPEYQRKIMYEFKIVPLEIVKANENKPIPFDLWDSYRTKYSWTTIFELPNEGTTDEMTYFYYSGEMERLFGENQIAKYSKFIPEEFRWTTVKKRAVPNDIKFLWIDNADGKQYFCNIEFVEKEILESFKEIIKDNLDQNIEILIRINIPKTTAAVQLISGDKKIFLKNIKVKISL